MTPWVVGIVLVVPGVVLAQQPEPAAGAPVFAERCASCHGLAMRGATAPPILEYVRHHTNNEVLAAMAVAHQNMLAPADSSTLLVELRALAGTNPTMASGGYTGSRGTGAGGRGRGAGPAGTPPQLAATTATAAVAPNPAPGAAPAVGAAAVGRRGTVASLPLTDGRTVSGTIAAESDFDVTLRAGSSFVHLVKRGSAYEEKRIEPKSDWLTYDGSITANRYSALDRINTTNVMRLGPAWIFPMVNSPRLEVTPVVADGIMYVTGWNEIFALDGTTGRELWTYSEPRHDGLLSEAGNGANRGAAISGDRVFMAMDHAHLVAFNRFTGEKLWDTEMAPFADGYSATVAPLIVGDLVVQGLSGGEEGARGFLDAYRISTGERVWRFHTIPAPGEKGAETWIGSAREHGCGATWLTGSYDPELDLIYWGIGNPCPDYTGDERLGDNLYTSSVVALFARTGELRWHYQFTPHDTHDWDSTEPMILADEVWQGQPRKLLIHPDRNGMFYVLDRTSGQFLLGENLSTKVTWLRGFTPEGRPIVDPASIATRDGVAACPGSNGGANWPAASYNPTTRLFYVRVADSCGAYASHQDPLGVSGNRWFGRGTTGPAAQRALAQLTADYPTGSYLRAMDPFSGKKVWDVPIAAARSGVLSTAGGLVFMGGNGGLVAWDARTGNPLWHVNVGQNSSASPMTYMVGGRQYLALSATGMIVAYRLYE